MSKVPVVDECELDDESESEDVEAENGLERRIVKRGAVAVETTSLTGCEER